MENPHYETLNTLINKGISVNINFYGNDKTVSSMIFLWDKIKEVCVPFLQNSCIYELGNSKSVYFSDLKNVVDPFDKLKQYEIHHLYTIGRYDINSSITWSMSPEEILAAKTLHKGKGHIAYPFFSKSGIEFDILVTKDGKKFKIVIESNKVYKDSRFTKIGKHGSYFLNEGWVDSERLIEIVKTL